MEIEIKHIKSHLEYDEFKKLNQNIDNFRRYFEQQKVGDHAWGNVEGTCIVCQKRSSFQFDFHRSSSPLVPDWREQLNCCNCKFNNRMRASMYLFDHLFQPINDAGIYLTEQVTPLFQTVVRNYPNAVGSEFLGEHFEAGQFNKDGIRNEDVTKLSFNDKKFNYILSFDVLEHVYDYTKALSEFYRVLDDGGILLLSCPVVLDSDDHLEMAKIIEGEIVYLQDPEYHGDPLNPEGGVLCFRYYGWNLISDLRKAGFNEIQYSFYWSAEYCYYGSDQLFIIAKK